MKKPLIIIDADNVCARNFYAAVQMRPSNICTTALVKWSLTLMLRYKTPKVAFCFDSDSSVRSKYYPKYKANRIQNEDREELNRQKASARDALVRFGFGNVFCEDGYEADDLIAACCKAKCDKIVLSSDKDLYQLIDGSTSVLPYVSNDVPPFTLADFRRVYGVEPSDWAWIKAVAGCTSDGVEGVRGVGERSAIKCLTGKMGRRSKIREQIDASATLIEHNLKLVKLPHEGCPEVTVSKDVVSVKGKIERVKKAGLWHLIPQGIEELFTKERT